MLIPFSLQTVQQYNVILQQPHYIKAQDEIKLAYYPFVAPQAKASIIFYHGGGAWSNGPYQHMAQELMHAGMNVYLTDIRGHGNSGGPRGDAPCAQHVWRDITTLVDAVYAKHPDIPIFLAGHSSGAGLILNYTGYKQHPAVRGYIFLSPFLGGRSGLNRTHTDPAQSFIKQVRLWAIIPHAISNGWLFNHTPALFFNYPEQVYTSDPHILRFYTCAMSAATSPTDAQQLYAQLQKPFGLFIGSQDEQFLPQETIDIAKYAKQVYAQSTAELIPDATHLSAIVAAPDYIIKTITKIIANS